MTQATVPATPATPATPHVLAKQVILCQVAQAARGRVVDEHLDAFDLTVEDHNRLACEIRELLESAILTVAWPVGRDRR